MIQQYINNPSLIDSLTPEQQIKVYQDLQEHYKSLENQQSQVQGKIQTLQSQAQDIKNKISESIPQDKTPEQYLQEQQDSLKLELQTNLQSLQQYNQI